MKKQCDSVNDDSVGGLAHPGKWPMNVI